RLLGRTLGETLQRRAAALAHGPAGPARSPLRRCGGPCLSLAPAFRRRHHVLLGAAAQGQYPNQREHRRRPHVSCLSRQTSHSPVLHLSAGTDLTKSRADVNAGTRGTRIAHGADHAGSSLDVPPVVNRSSPVPSVFII